MFFGVAKDYVHMNCSAFGCSASRKTKGIVIFRVPTRDEDYGKEWRQKCKSTLETRI